MAKVLSIQSGLKALCPHCNQKTAKQSGSSSKSESWYCEACGITFETEPGYQENPEPYNSTSAKPAGALGDSSGDWSRAGNSRHSSSMSGIGIFQFPQPVISSSPPKVPGSDLNLQSLGLQQGGRLDLAEQVKADLRRLGLLHHSSDPAPLDMACDALIEQIHAGRVQSSGPALHSSSVQSTRGLSSASATGPLDSAVDDLISKMGKE